VKLYLIRHAAAAERSADRSDEARPLTVEGRDRFRRVAKGLARRGVRFDRLLHSPLLRAVETAELLSGLLSGETAVLGALAAPPDEGMLGELEGGSGARSVALVGHEPHLSALLALLVVGIPEAGGGFLMKKGGVALLEGTPRPGAMRLVALLPPRFSR
jgi:phosphohistidine phosphatase